MKLRYITCSDPREHNSIKSIMELARMPNAEIAVQCHPSKMSYNMPRNCWFDKLLIEAKYAQDINLAIHINNEWSKTICTYGIIPDTILEWIKLEKSPNKPIIKRIQLNTTTDIHTHLMAAVIHSFPNQEFIFQYNDNTKSAIQKLHKTGAKFSLLFDASGGRGVTPKSWEKPIYETHPMGYSGGMSPDNVIGNLRQIDKAVPKDSNIWIDAD